MTEAIQNMEPEAASYGCYEIAPLISIAVSLKRIADALEGGRFGNLDFETAAERAGQAFSIGMRGR